MGRGGGHEQGRDRGGEREDAHESRSVGGFEPIDTSSDETLISRGTAYAARSRSYARTHFRTALSLTPYFAPDRAPPRRRHLGEQLLIRRPLHPPLRQVDGPASAHAMPHRREQ